jgi:ketosteroid isomerase-like protein
MVGAFSSRRLAAGLLAVTLAACTTRRVQQSAEVTATATGAGTDDVQGVVRLALTLDAAADRKADTLYASDAVVLGNARMRLAAPRFAGIGGAGTGRVTITAANATVSGGLAWVLVDYRWISSTDQRAEVGRATVICERRGSGWKIVHAHSSQPLPWDP